MRPLKSIISNCTLRSRRNYVDYKDKLYMKNTHQNMIDMKELFPKVDIFVRLVPWVSTISRGGGRVTRVYRGGLDLDIGWILVVGSWFVGLDISPESIGIGYVVHLPVDAVSVGVSVASLYVTFAVTGFFAILSEFAIVASDVVAKVVRNGDVLKNVTKNGYWCIFLRKYILFQRWLTDTP